jgi:iron(III) transport system permease protein
VTPTIEGPAVHVGAAGPSRGAAGRRDAARDAARGAASSIPLAVRLPALLVAASMLVPVGYLVMVAAQLPPARILELALEPRTLELARRSVGLALTVTLASIVIAVPVAWLTERTDLPARRTLGIAAALPLVIPTYVGAFALVSALGPGGLVAELTGWTPPSPYGFRGAAVALTLLSYPYVLLTVRGALRGLDPSLEEASRTLGRGAFVTFLRVVLPQLRPSIAAGGLLVSLYVLSDFGAVAMLRTQTFTRAIFLQYRTAFDRAPAAVLGIMLVLITLLVLALESRVGRADRSQLARRGPTRPPAQVPLGPWRWPAAVLVGVVLFIALALPLLVVGWWLVRGLAAGQPVDAALAPMLRTLGVAAIGAVAATLAALPIALWSSRDASLASHASRSASPTSATRSRASSSRSRSSTSASVRCLRSTRRSGCSSSPTSCSSCRRPSARSARRCCRSTPTSMRPPGRSVRRPARSYGACCSR